MHSAILKQQMKRFLLYRVRRGRTVKNLLRPMEYLEGKSSGKDFTTYTIVAHILPKY